MKVFILLTLLGFTSVLLSENTVEELSKRLDRIEQAAKENTDKLHALQKVIDSLRAQVQSLTCPHAVNDELPVSFTSAPITQEVPLYVLFDHGRSGIAQNFIDYLEQHLPFVALHVINEADQIPEPISQHTVVLYGLFFSSERWDALHDAQKIKRCAAQSNNHCIVTVLRKIRSNAPELKSYPPEAQTSSTRVLPYVRALEFRYTIEEQFYPPEKDSNNKDQLAILERILKTKQQ